MPRGNNLEVFLDLKYFSPVKVERQRNVATVYQKTGNSGSTGDEEGLTGS